MSDAQIVDLKYLAELLDLTDRRVQQLEKEGVVVKAKRGEYELKASVQGYIQSLREQADGNQGELRDQKIRKIRAEADIAEASAKEKTGELINKNWALVAWGEAVQMMKTNMLGLPPKLAQLTRAARSDAEAIQILENGIKKALTAIAKVEIVAIEVEDQS